MTSARRNPGRRNAARVATVFTGAAVAAGTFIPSAMANTSGRVSGTIQKQPCSGRGTWLHIAGQLLGDVRCFGFSGLYDVSSGSGSRHPWTIVGLCGGNNFGVINPKYADHQGYSVGNWYRNEHSFTMNSVRNAGWVHGNNTQCPMSP